MSSGEIDAATAVAQLAPDVDAVVQSERVALSTAAGRVLAADVSSVLDVPAFDNAAMDGYAVRASDCRGGSPLHAVGTALAGHPYAGMLRPGDAVRVMTGAAIPAGADAVVMLEDVTIVDSAVHTTATPAAGLHVRPRGEHLQAGRVALAQGRRLRSHDLGLLAVAGIAAVEVVRRLRVGVLSTGDELHDAPAPLPASGQYDGNRPLLLASLARAGYDVRDLGIVADHSEALASILRRAADDDLDAVVSSGGVAQGDADFVRRLPQLRFLELSLRPGRGIAFGRLGKAGGEPLFFGLPGNGVAAYVMLQFVVHPLLARRAGAAPEAPLCLQAPLAVDARTRPGRTDWRRARFIQRYGQVAVEPLPQQGSSMLRTLSDADALVAIGPQAVTAAGEWVDVVPLSGLP